MSNPIPPPGPVEALFARRRPAADQWYYQSDLNGFQIENAEGWEMAGKDEIMRTIFVAPDVPGEDNGSIRKALSVHFKPGTADIDHANINGIEVDGSQNWTPPSADEPDDRVSLLDSAKFHNVTAQELAIALEIDPDRLNNGGVAEVIDLALAEGDDAEYIAKQIDLINENRPQPSDLA